MLPAGSPTYEIKHPTREENTGSVLLCGNTNKYRYMVIKILYNLLFVTAQLDEIRKTSLAGIICDNSDEVTSLQPEVMRSVNPSNARVPCSQVPRPDLTKWTQPIKSSNLGAKYTRISISVTSGLITTTTGQVLWDGSFPLSVPVPLFSVKRSSAGPTVFGHGIQWKGTVSLLSNRLEISGTFSSPVFTHGPIPFGTNYTVQWINGDFKFNGLVTSNDTDISGLVLPNTYESPIYFSSIKADAVNLNKQFVLGDMEDSPLVVGVEKLPLILSGSFSPDRTSFSWSGNATLSILTVPAAPALSLTDSSAKSSGLFNVVGGSINLDSPNGGSAVLWSGTLPAAIPLPLPYKVLETSESGEKLPVFGNGLLWSTSVSGSLLEGSFRFPQYKRTLKSVSVNWLSGQFSLEVVPLFNKSFDDLIIPGVQYTSRILFRQEEPATPYLQLGSVFSNDLDAPDSLEDLVVESQDVIDGSIAAPLILHGTFSPDKTVFYFNGKVIIAVKPSTPKIIKQLKSLSGPELSLPSWGSPRFGGRVNSGSITAGINGNAPIKVWSGTFPLAITMPTFFSPVYDSLGGKSFLFGNGVVWSGTINGLTVKGNYSLPQTIWSITGVKQQNWLGQFAFDVTSLWNSSLDTLFVPGAKYYSKIHFQGAKYDPGLSTLKGVPGQDDTVTMAAPIILQGSHSLDKKTFYWSGSFIIAFQNKPTLMFTIPEKPKPVDETPKKDRPVKSKHSITIDVTSGSVNAGFIGTAPTQVWSGSLPATIPYSALISPAEKWRTVPSTNVIWSGEVKDKTFQGIFSLPTYLTNGTSEIIQWWAGNFSFKYTPRFGKLLEDYVRPGRKNIFALSLGAFVSSNIDQTADESKNSLLQLTEEANKVIVDAKKGKITLQGKYFSKAFYCYIIPFCADKKEYYWSGTAILTFPDPPKNKSGNELLKASMVSDKTGSVSSQILGQVISGSVEGGLTGESTNSWWTGSLPLQIPISIFWTNQTQASPGLGVSHNIEWSGTLVGNTLKGTFSFPQLVLDIPAPTVQWWSGQFDFNVQPLWNSSFEGLILPEAKYISGIYFQGVKAVYEKSKQHFVLGDDSGVKKQAPIILQGTLSPDGANFLWSGKFIMSLKNYPTFSLLSLGESKAKDDAEDKPSKPPKPTKPIKPVKPKTTASFTVISGHLSATNGSEPVDIWGGKMPVDINTSMFNPTNSPGAGVSVTWTAETIEPQLSGSFEVRVYLRNESILVPVTWTGNFSMYYLIKWAGSFDGLVKPGQKFTCNVIFKEMTKSLLEEDPGYIAKTASNQLVLSESSGTPCTLALTGKSFTTGVDPFYCQLIPFMCSNKAPTNWFTFNGDALFILKLPTPSSEKQFLGKTTPAVQWQGARQVNTTVIAGSIVAGPESEFPRTLWSGVFPLEIPLPVFWNAEDSSNKLTPPEDIVHAHGVIWSGSQMGPRIEGTFSIPRYTKKGVNWWTGRFNFLLETSWGVLGDLDEVIKSGIYYNSKIVFRDVYSPLALQSPSQFDVDTSTSMPIILLGTYSPNKKIFYWAGNTIIGLRNNLWTTVNKSPSFLQSKGPYFPSKPKTRVGLLVSKGSIINNTNSTTPIWSGKIPVTIPLTVFNLTEGVNVLWTPLTLSPKFTGNFSIPQTKNDADGFKVNWIEGEFSFDLTTLWNTSINVIEVGKQYATVISSSTTKYKENKNTSLTSLIMEFVGLEDYQEGRLTVKGTLSPDQKFFTWLGEAWFSLNTNKTIKSETPQQLNFGISSPKPYGGAVYDGYVTAKKSNFFSFLSHTVWSGNLPVTISFSSFWSGFISGATFTKGATWTATSVSDSILEGSYSVPQYTWDGLTTSVTWYKGDFKFYVRPLWNVSLSSIVVPGTQYYSRIEFQGAKTPLAASEGPVDYSGIPAPIILQGTYSPDHTSFFWSGNFIMDIKNTPTLL